MDVDLYVGLTVFVSLPVETETGEANYDGEGRSIRLSVWSIPIGSIDISA